MSDKSSKAQIIVALFGLIGVLGSALLAHWPKAVPTPTPPTPTQSSSLSSSSSESLIHFNITNNLGTDFGQVSEQVAIWINGQMVGTLTVNNDYPKSVLRVTVLKSDHYTFTANAIAKFRDGIERTCAGQGNINVSRGKSFILVANIGGNNCTVLLAEE